MNLLELISDNFVAIFLGGIAIIYSLTAIMLTKKIQHANSEKRKEFHETLIKGLMNGTIESFEDLINLYKGITNLSSDDLAYRQGINKWLRQIFANLLGLKICENLSSTEINEIKKKITFFILTNEKTSPFSELPDMERNILKDLNSFLDNNDKEASERKIKELSNVIQTRYEEQKKIKSQNKWSIPLAIIGVIFTVLFGILSFF